VRRPRLTIENGIYHCISRITGGRFWIEDVGKGVWCDQLKRVSVFCGVQILTYAVMDNHFHLLVHVPRTTKLSDEILIERYRSLYPHRPKLVQDVEDTLREGGIPAEEMRQRLHARMHDLSQFLKELKQRFTMWYNSHHKLFGTIWDGRFKSILVENETSALQTVAAYIDLNPLRAGIVKEPNAYRWCGLSSANRGDPLAKAGLVALTRARGWAEAQAVYRRFVHEAGIHQVKDKPHATLEAQNIKAIPTDQSLMRKQKWLSEGWIVGSRKFVWANIRTYGAHLRSEASDPCLKEVELRAEVVALAGRGRTRVLESLAHHG